MTGQHNFEYIANMIKEETIDMLTLKRQVGELQQVGKEAMVALAHEWLRLLPLRCKDRRTPHNTCSFQNSSCHPSRFAGHGLIRVYRKAADLHSAARTGANDKMHTLSRHCKVP